LSIRLGGVILKSLKGETKTSEDADKTAEMLGMRLLESDKRAQSRSTVADTGQSLTSLDGKSDATQNEPGLTENIDSSWEQRLEKHPEKTADQEKQDEFLLPMGSGEVDGNMDSWEENEMRGKPRINLALTVFSLLLVVAIAYVALKLYAKYVMGDKDSPLFKKKLVNIKERHALAPNKMLCVVELPDRVVLLGVSDNEINLLTEIDPAKVEEFEYQPRQEVSEQSSASSYLTDVLFRKWQGSNK
jgi:flagellar protein FliO/FliZ